MSQEWFSVGKPFYLVQIFFSDQEGESSKVRQFLYANRTMVATTIRSTHPDCRVTIIRFPGPRVVYVQGCLHVWQGFARDFKMQYLLDNRKARE